MEDETLEGQERNLEESSESPFHMPDWNGNCIYDVVERRIFQCSANFINTELFYHEAKSIFIYLLFQ